METIVVHGGFPLRGEIEISGAKNSVLPLMISALLTAETVELLNVPYLSDVIILTQLLEQLGLSLSARSGNKAVDLQNTTESTFEIVLNAATLNNFTAPSHLVERMRASFWVLAPLLARFGQAKVALPGGCNIGSRNFDLHLETLRAMGATVTLQDGYIVGAVKNKLRATQFTFSKVSVGATINALYAAVLAEGESTFRNCAFDPEIVDLCHMLSEMGAEISGIGTSRLTVKGKDVLSGARHKVIPDRIEAATFIAAVGLTGGRLILHNIDCSSLDNLCEVFLAAGIKITRLPNCIIAESDRCIKPMNIRTAPYPEFPTDMQAQFTALLCVASGISTIEETMFESRFKHVPELRRMGAEISLTKNRASIKGYTHFKGAEVVASDLRASVCLVLAGLAASGMTVIRNIHHIDRGYSRIEQKLGACGAKITRQRSSVH